MLDKHNLVNLSKGVMRALGQIPSSTFAPADFEELQTKVSKLSNLIRVVDEDHQKAGRFLMAKIRSIPTHPGPLGRGLGALGGPLLSMLMRIVDDAGVEKGMLGQLLQGIQVLMSENILLQDRLESLLHEISAQGGIVLDGLALTLESQVLAAVFLECPNGDAFKVFLDVMSLFCCDLAYEPMSGWAKFTLAMEFDYPPTARKMVALYYQTHCFWYIEGKQVVAGKVLAGFKESEKWNSGSGMDGRHHKIKTSAAMAANIAKT